MEMKASQTSQSRNSNKTSWKNSWKECILLHRALTCYTYMHTYKHKINLIHSAHLPSVTIDVGVAIKTLENNDKPAGR